MSVLWILARTMATAAAEAAEVAVAVAVEGQDLRRSAWPPVGRHRRMGWRVRWVAPSALGASARAAAVVELQRRRQGAGAGGACKPGGDGGGASRGERGDGDRHG